MSQLQSLATLLRNRSKWPDDFEWDYSDKMTCAIGLARASGIKIPRMSTAANEDIFYNPIRGFYRTVTPEIVADRIDRYLAERPRRPKATA